jgi:hypothetical protein
MNRSRRAAISVVLAMLALGAVFASSAAATTPQWIVAGSALGIGATEAIAPSTTVTETFSIKAAPAGISLKLECKKVTLPGSVIKGERTRIDNEFKLENCTFIGPASCSGPSAVTLEPLTSTLEGTAGSFKLKFSPTTTGGPVMFINITGASCALAGPFEVKGTMSCNYPGVETEQRNHVLEFSLASGSELKHGTEKVTLTGKDEFWLKSEKFWKVA